MTQLYQREIDGIAVTATDEALFEKHMEYIMSVENFVRRNGFCIN